MGTSSLDPQDDHRHLRLDDELIAEAVQRVRDRRSPGDVVMSALPKIVHEREELRAWMPTDRDWTREEGGALEGAYQEARDRIISEDLVAAGYDPNMDPEEDEGLYWSMDVIDYLVEGVETLESERLGLANDARMEQMRRDDPSFDARWKEAGLDNGPDPEPPEYWGKRDEYPDKHWAWESVYGQPPCSTRAAHSPLSFLPVTRPRARCSRRRHASRRAAGVRSGQDPGDGDPDPEPPALSRYFTDEQAAFFFGPATARTERLSYLTAGRPALEQEAGR